MDESSRSFNCRSRRFWRDNGARNSKLVQNTMAAHKLQKGKLTVLKTTVEFLRVDTRDGAVVELKRPKTSPLRQGNVFHCFPALAEETWGTKVVSLGWHAEEQPVARPASGWPTERRQGTQRDEPSGRARQVIKRPLHQLSQRAACFFDR
jgi:hypothetical protein